MRSRGFTLIELMVVIIIIAILSTVGIVYYANFLKNSRDAKRQSDLKFIQSGLEGYHADNLSYPSDLNSLTSAPKTYMTNLPHDPKTSPDYKYELRLGTGYCLYTVLEIQRPASDAGCNPQDPYKYGVTKP